MATERVCPHAITLYNFLGSTDAQGNDMYSCTLLAGVHVHYNEGVIEVDNPDDSTRVHIFDDLVSAMPTEGFKIDKTLYNLTPYNLQRALQTPHGEKPFVPFSEWIRTTNREQYWTLSPEGRDYFSIGDNRKPGTKLPIGSKLFRIVKVGRREMGSERMWHWRIEGK